MEHNDPRARIVGGFSDFNYDDIPSALIELRIGNACQDQGHAVNELDMISIIPNERT